MAAHYAISPAEDDAVIRQRLLTRTTTTRGEPPLKKVIKKFTALAVEIEKEGSSNYGECEKMYKSFLQELATFELPLLKTKAVIHANRREQESFKDLHVELNQQISQAQRDIEELKVQLEEAKIERQHKEECEAIRKLIAAQSPRLATQKQLNELEKELVQLEAENFAAHRTIELRKKQFSLLLHVVDDLQTTLEEEQKNPVDFEALDLPSLPLGDSTSLPEPMAVDLTMAGMSVEDALAYLKTLSTTSGDDAFTHISEIVRSVLQAKTKDAVDILETSFILKKTRFISHEGEKPVQAGRDPKDVIPVKSFFSLFNQKEEEPKSEEDKPKKKDGEEEEEEEPPAEEEPPENEFEAQNMLSDSVFYDAAGCGIGRLDTYLVILALKKLGDDPKAGIESVRFFGKFFGISNNYYVFESTLKEGAGEEEEEEAAEEGEEGGEEDEDKPKKKKDGWGRPNDGIPPEEGVGTNANVYWYCHRPGDQCKKLPPVTPLQVKTARQLKKYLTGNPEAEVSGFPPFPGVEANYLRAMVARIGHATQVAPGGFYTAEESEEGAQTVTPVEDFEMPPSTELSNLEAWVHKMGHITKQGRCTKYDEPEPEEGEEPEEAEEEEEEEGAEKEGGEEEEEAPEEPEEEPGALRTLDQDKDIVEGIKAWSMSTSSSIKNLKHQVVCLRSHRWPGAFCVATPTSFSNIYVGYGLKNEEYKPAMPPLVQNEYAGDLTEATDLPPKPPTPEAEDGEGRSEEGEGEEEY